MTILTTPQDLTVSKHNYLYCILSGGSVANMYALNVARHAMYPDMKKTGMSKPLVVFTSEQVGTISCNFSAPNAFSYVTHNIQSIA